VEIGLRLNVVPAICYSVLAYIFVTESPRWLLTQGRHQEAMAMLTGVSSLENDNDLTVIEALNKSLQFSCLSK
jgi:hypothetical protein